MIVLSKREAMQVAVSEKNPKIAKRVLRRSFYSADYKAGDVVPVATKQGEKPLWLFRVMRVNEITVGRMTDGKAQQEGFDSLAEWKDHWTATLYPRSKKRHAPDTVVFEFHGAFMRPRPRPETPPEQNVNV